MENFRMDNTEGFDQETLDKMNAEYEELIDGEPEYAHKAISDKVFNKYC